MAIMKLLWTILIQRLCNTSNLNSGKIKEWEEPNDESRKNGNSEEHFSSSLLKSVNPSGHKVIVCEPSFLEKAMQSFPEDKKKIIIENPKCSCIFNC